MIPTALGVTKNPATAEQLAILLQMLDHADGAAQLQARLRADSGGPVTVDWHWQTATDPTWAVCYHAEWTLLLASGCRNIDQAARTALGYLGNRFNPFPTERTQNQYFTDIAARMFTVIDGQPGIQNQPLRLAGHSLGGCVVQSLAWLLRTQQRITNNCQICTFGSPKWGWRWQQEQIAAVPQARWMNSDDPVPLFYPTINDYLPMLLQYTTVQASTVARYTQAAGGLVIAADGDIVGADYPPLTGVRWRVAMGAWLWGFEDGGPTNPHSLSQYQARLHIFNDRDVPPRLLPRGAEGIAPIEENNRRLVNRAEAAVERQLARVEGQQRERPQRIPVERLVTYQRRGRVHVLLWNDQVISVVVRRRSAASLARDCNRFLHHLLHAGLVEPDSIVQQLQLFLGAAQDPTSGIEPRIVTTLPDAEA